MKKLKQLKPHQKEGVRYLYNKGSAILGDEMGLGKTLQALALGAVLLKRGKVEQVLVLCPAALLSNWQNEFKKWLGFYPFLYHGTKRSVDTSARGEWILTSYTTLAKDIEHLGPRLKSKLLIVCDEAHKLRNGSTDIASAVRRLARARTVLMTGTPIENRPEDLHSLLYLVAPDEVGTVQEFYREYITMRSVEIRTKYGAVLYQEKPAGVKPDALYKLRALLQSVMLRREKKNLPNLPQLRIQYVPYEINRKTEKLYDMVLDVCGDLELGLGSTIIRLRQVLDGIVKTHEDPNEYSFFVSAKARLLQEILGNRSGQCIVWFAYSEALYELAELWEADLPIYTYTGRVSLRERDRVLQRWKNDSDGILFATIKAAGTGLNLTEAADAIFYSAEWTPSENKQAQERIHRMGQDRNCTVYYLYGKGSLEAVILAMLKRKARVASSIVDLKTRKEKEMKEFQQYALKLISGEGDLSRIFKELEI